MRGREREREGGGEREREREKSLRANVKFNGQQYSFWHAGNDGRSQAPPTDHTFIVLVV